MIAIAKCLMLLASLSLAVGCSGWAPIPLHRRAVLDADLEAKEVRFTTERGRAVMTVHEVMLPPADDGLHGGHLHGEIAGRSVLVPFDDFVLLEARTPSFFRSAAFEDTMNTIGYVVVVGGLVALAIWAAHDWPHHHHHH